MPARGMVVDAPAPPKRRIKWGRICGVWFLLVLGYILATNQRITPENEAQLVYETQVLVGLAFLPAIVRGFYRRLFSD